MGIKKKIVYICCVFAGMILLAHSFIPHIHHDGAICFLKIHACASPIDGNDEAHDHGPLEDCKLSDLQIRPESNEGITPDLSDQFLLNYHLIFVQLEQVLLQTEITQERQHKPYLLLYTSVLADSIHSLRAPPMSFHS
ncbi:DUF6769 family protein [Massilibacteroides sp.]|uniref:DUF6769 family protein n=1 Tax=Massilibacteroides sp. TaxID=2034766 RepID=UPI00262F406A|nr:DUF6769 family protein [Massilibacteroides sp.]MDD4516708.1 hypothetical protein [Massilibacteroides sp.]